MKRILSGLSIILAVLLVASCSLFSDLADAFDAYDINADVTSNGVETFALGDIPKDADAYVGTVVEVTLDSYEMESFVRGLDYKKGIWAVVTYDTAYLDYLGSYYPDATTEFMAARKLTDEGTVKTLVVPYETMTFSVKPDSPIGVTPMTFELIREGYAAEYTKIITINLNVIGMDDAIEMAGDETTRLYNPQPSETLKNISAPRDLTVRGIVPGSLSRTSFRYDSLNLTKHDYQVTILPQNYAEYLTITFRNDEIVTSQEFSTSNDYRSIDYYILADSGIFDSEEYANGEDIQLRIFVSDLTDSKIYYSDIIYPVEDYSGSLCSFTEFAAATNGNMAVGALVGTRVYIDAAMEAFSPEDGFSNAMIGVYGPDGELVASTTISVWDVGVAANGTLSTGWDGVTELFTDDGRFSFVPEVAGTYTVTIYGYDSNGYNLTASSGKFEVTN